MRIIYTRREVKIKISTWNLPGCHTLIHLGLVCWIKIQTHCKSIDDVLMDALAFITTERVADGRHDEQSADDSEEALEPE